MKGQMMGMSDLENIKLPDVQALISFGKLGFNLLASRMLSVLSMLGIIALSFDSVYSSSWQGAACVGILSLLVFLPSLRAESRRGEPKGE
jgi:hypothetical protein